MKRFRLLIPALALLMAVLMLSAALAVTYTEDGGMVVGGDGDDDFSNIVPADPDASYITIILPGDEDEPQYDENGNLITPGPGPTFAPGERLDVSLALSSGKVEPVTLLSTGVYYSTVIVGRETHRVQTENLRYEIADNVPAEKRLAIINAKKDGYATMHTKAKASSPSVNRCTTNRVVLVLSIGKSYSKVWYDGDVGFVKTSSLTFLAPAEEAVRLATVTYKGRTASKATVNIRQNGKTSSRSLDTIACGTPMVVLGETEDGWYEVEVAGWRAWIPAEYATMNEDIVEENTVGSAVVPVPPAPTPEPSQAEPLGEMLGTLTEVTVYDGAGHEVLYDDFEDLPQP